MTRQVDVKALISHLVRGDGAEKCRICMGETTEGQVYLGDTVMVDGEKPVTLAELLEQITGVEVSYVKCLNKVAKRTLFIFCEKRNGVSARSLQDGRQKLCDANLPNVFYVLDFSI